MATGTTVRVSGLKDLSRALSRIDKGVAKTELVEPLKAAGEDVKRDAESFALGRIRNMPLSPRWAGMRIGVSQAQGVVFMVPQARSRRGRGTSRPNLSRLLLERAMDPAKEKNAANVERKVDELLGRLAGENGF